MNPEIAVMLADDGITTTLTGPGEVVIYSKVHCSWEPVRKIPFSLDQSQGLMQTRKRMEELVTFMGDCRIFVTRSASGVIFFELEKAQCSVWEISGRPEGFLDEILQEEIGQDQHQQNPSSEIPVPVETTPGYYYLSIKDLQGKRPEFSSKQILQNFIRNGTYEHLEVICDHVPPWIALESVQCGFSLQNERIGPNEVKVILTKNPKDGCGCMG